MIASAFVVMGLASPLSEPAFQHEKPTKKELKALIASAKTPAEHERIAAFYRAEAQRLEAKLREHDLELAEYYKNPLRYPSKYPTMGDHCRSLATYYKMAAQQAATQAEMHEKLAQESKKAQPWLPQDPMKEAKLP